MPASDRKRVDLSVITADDVSKAIEECMECGRRSFLRRYGRSRSSKFYLLVDGRVFDTKALAASAYRHAVGARRSVPRFSGGSQTKAIIDRFLKAEGGKRRGRWFEDTFGELSNLSGEFDRLPAGKSTIQGLGFSDWIAFDDLSRANTVTLPGVYVVAHIQNSDADISVIDKRVVYVGETTRQSLKARLRQFQRSICGGDGHSGGRILFKAKVDFASLSFAIRPFALDYRTPSDISETFRAAQVKHLERLILHEYVLANKCLPMGNSK
jgi:hypothetical protein